MVVTINRVKQTDKVTLGELYLHDDCNNLLFKCKTVEREWNDNNRSISCIPKGSYKVVKTHSPRFKKDLYLVKDVPNRSGIRFHSANYSYQLNGCIALGKTFADINQDGVIDVTSSVNTHKEFDKILEGKGFDLVIN